MIIMCGTCGEATMHREFTFDKYGAEYQCVECGHIIGVLHVQQRRFTPLAYRFFLIVMVPVSVLVLIVAVLVLLYGR